MDERFYWLGFSAFPGIGPVKFSALLKYFGTAKNAWSAKQTDLRKVLGLNLTGKFEEFKDKFSIENYAIELEKKKVSFLILSDKEYPALLKQINNPPFVLYIKSLPTSKLSSLSAGLSLSNDLRGTKLNRTRNNTEKKFCVDQCLIPCSSVFEQRTIAVVGTRKITEYGRQVTELLTRELVNAGFTIVSGLALGVDAVAHKTAIENGGKTIAVLGSGVDLCYPSANQYLYNKIINGNGCVVSQFPVGQEPTQGSFPSRNKIIAGLSMGVLVTEGAEDSGALITADYALSNGRRVFAVPGPITSSLSHGPYKLISKGAKLVTSVKDILEELKFEYQISKFETNSKSQNTKKKTEIKEEQRVLEILENEGMGFDEIVRRLKLDSAKAGSILSLMEIKGLIKNSGGIFSIRI